MLLQKSKAKGKLSLPVNDFLIKKINSDVTIEWIYVDSNVATFYTYLFTYFIQLLVNAGKNFHKVYK